jgi:hypothetical protein
MSDWECLLLTADAAQTGQLDAVVAQRQCFMQTATMVAVDPVSKHKTREAPASMCNNIPFSAVMCADIMSKAYRQGCDLQRDLGL